MIRFSMCSKSGYYYTHFDAPDNAIFGEIKLLAEEAANERIDDFLYYESLKTISPRRRLPQTLIVREMMPYLTKDGVQRFQTKRKGITFELEYYWVRATFSGGVVGESGAYKCKEEKCGDKKEEEK